MTDKILEALEIGLRYSEEISNALYGVSKDTFRTVEEAEEDVRKIEVAISLYKEQQANEKWVPWNGGCMPVDEDIVVEHEMAGGGVCKAQSGCLEWVHMGNEWDIVAYRVISSGE